MPRRSPRRFVSRVCCALLDIDASVFAHICSFLSLDTKLFTLAPLCRGALNAALACRQDVVSVNGPLAAPSQQVAHLSPRAASQLKHARYVKCLLITGSLPRASVDESANVLSCVQAAIESTALRCIRIVDASVDGVNMLHVMLNSLLQSGSASRVLTFGAEYGPHGEVPMDQRHLVYYRTPGFSWAGLGKMTSLTSLDLHLHQNETTVELTRYLPPTLTELHVIANFDHAQDEWSAAFESMDFLPRLLYFEANDLYLTGPMFTTLMLETGCVRPFSSMRWSHCTPNQLSLLPHSVTRIETAMQATQTGFELVSDQYLPHLEYAHIHISDDYDELPVIGPNGFDCSPLLGLLSRRPLQELVLTLTCDTEPLSDAAVRALASMTSLRRLSITSTERYQQCLIVSRDLSQLLPAGSWPHLIYLALRLRDIDDFDQFEHLHFYLNDMISPCHVAAFAASAPALQYLMLNVKEPGLPLASLAQTCPDIKSILCLRHERDYVTHVSYASMLHHIPVPTVSFLHLTSLIITTHQFEHRALHWLFNQLTPRLIRAEFIKGSDPQCGRARFFYAMFRSLHDLSCMKLLGDRDDNDISFVFDMYHRDSSDGGFEFVQPFRIGETGLFQAETGRISFFYTLTESLCDEERALLAEWDKCNYDWQPRRSKRIRERDTHQHETPEAIRRKLL